MYRTKVISYIVLASVTDFKYTQERLLESSTFFGPGGLRARPVVPFTVSVRSRSLDQPLVPGVLMLLFRTFHCVSMCKFVGLKGNISDEFIE